MVYLVADAQNQNVVRKDRNNQTFPDDVPVNPSTPSTQLDFFGVGSDDAITILDATRAIVSEVGLSGTGTDDETYALFEDEYKYTTSTSPGAPNVYTTPVPLAEKLTARNVAGNAFFLEDSDTFRAVVDIYIEVDGESFAILRDHPAWETWVDFIEFSVSNSDENFELGSDCFSEQGPHPHQGPINRIGHPLLGIAEHPIQVNFDVPFLGMETLYLRNHLGDPSYMRD